MAAAAVTASTDTKHSSHLTAVLQCRGKQSVKGMYLFVGQEMEFTLSIAVQYSLHLPTVVKLKLT